MIRREKILRSFKTNSGTVPYIWDKRPVLKPGLLSCRYSLYSTEKKFLELNLLLFPDILLHRNQNAPTTLGYRCLAVVSHSLVSSIFRYRPASERFSLLHLHQAFRILRYYLKLYHCSDRQHVRLCKAHCRLAMKSAWEHHRRSLQAEPQHLQACY